MTDHATMPPVDPDPQAIDHLEGSVRTRRVYREAAEVEHESARREAVGDA
ncbi:MAG: hypothetical protein M0Z33_06020 [Actinomycetota bacterium]|nr:hypothetical protein [Actinomycetota bacterium]